MKRFLKRSLTAVLALAISFTLVACGDPANSNDNMTGTSTVDGSSGGSSDGAIPGNADGQGGGTNGNSSGGSGNPGP